MRLYFYKKKKNVQNFKDTTNDSIMILCFIVIITHVSSRQKYFLEISGILMER